MSRLTNWVPTNAQLPTIAKEQDNALHSDGVGVNLSVQKLRGRLFAKLSRKKARSAKMILIVTEQENAILQKITPKIGNATVMTKFAEVSD